MKFNVPAPSIGQLFIHVFANESRYKFARRVSLDNIQLRDDSECFRQTKWNKSDVEIIRNKRKCLATSRTKTAELRVWINKLKSDLPKHISALSIISRFNQLLHLSLSIHLMCGSCQPDDSHDTNVSIFHTHVHAHLNMNFAFCICKRNGHSQLICECIRMNEWICWKLD